MQSRYYFLAHNQNFLEYPSLVILATLFMFIFISAFNFMTMYIALIGFSLTLYALILYNSKKYAGCEAGLKYYFLSIFSSALILFGIFLIYYKFGTTNFISIKLLLNDLMANNVIRIDLLLVNILLLFFTLGFLFKLSSFPCQL